MHCPSGYSCGGNEIPPGWINSHGSADYCDFGTDCYMLSQPPPDPGCIHMWTQARQSEGVITYPFYELLEGETYSVSFQRAAFNGIISNIFVRLISSESVSHIIPTGQLFVWNTPDILDSPGVCQTILHEQNITLMDTWEEKAVTFTANADYDAVWIYIYNASASTERHSVYIDNFNIKYGSHTSVASSNAGDCILAGNTLRLYINETDSRATYQWTGPNGFSSTQKNPVINNITPSMSGTYTVKVNINGFCYTSGTEVACHSLYVNAGDDRSICYGHGTTLGEMPVASGYFPGQNLTFTYDWAPNGPFMNGTGASQPRPIVKPESTTTYTLTVTSNFGCSVSDQVTVTVNPLPQITVSSNSPICEGGDLQLSANYIAGATYTWYWHGMPIHYMEHLLPGWNATGRTVTRTNVPWTFGQNYQVIVSDANGCTSSGNINIKTYPNNRAFVFNCGHDDYFDYFNASADHIFYDNFIDFLNDQPQEYCPGSDILIGSCEHNTMVYAFEDNYENYYWSGPNGFISTDKNPIIRNATSLNNGIYYLTMTSDNGNCVKTASTEITVSPGWPSYTEILQKCKGDYIALTTPETDNIISSVWSGPNGFNSILIDEIIFNGDLEDAGTYRLNVEYDNGCTATATKQVSVLPRLDITYDITYTEGEDNANVYFRADTDLTHSVAVGTHHNCDITYDITIYRDNSVVYQTDFLCAVRDMQSFNLELSPGSYKITTTTTNANYSCVYNQYFHIFGNLNIDGSLTPVTCDLRGYYNGELNLSIAGGFPPYNIGIIQDGSLPIAYKQVNSDGSHTIPLPEIAPSSSNQIRLKITDNSGIVYYYTCGYLTYAWHGNNTIHSPFNILPEYSDKILNIALYDVLNIANVSFTNCVIYINSTENGWSNPGVSQLNVMTGYPLTFENCTIMPGCPDRMWQGIKATGNNARDHTLTGHAKIVMNNSEIHGARKALESVSGGIIIATNSKFYNNEYAIYLTAYQYDHSQTKISFCEFITNKVFSPITMYPKAHVRLDNIKGITFIGNNFENALPANLLIGHPERGIPGGIISVTPYYTNHRGKGIEAVNSSFSVTHLSRIYIPNLDAVRNTFTGLYYGIEINGQKSTAPSVYHAIFTNNFKGILLKATTGSKILYNSFEATTETPTFSGLINQPVNGLPSDAVKYSVYVHSAQDYKIEENIIKLGNAGIYVYNSGEAGGFEVYKNTFENQSSAGTIVVGKNSNWDINNQPITHTGLQVRCNKYTGSNYAVSVLNGNMRKNQGDPGGATDKLAGNQFHSTLRNAREFTVQINSSGLQGNYSHLNLGTYNYYQHDDRYSANNGFYRELTANSVGVVGYTVRNVTFEEPRSCLSNNYTLPIVIDPPVIIMPTKQQEIAVLENGLSDIETEYYRLTDKGSTENLVSVAEQMNITNYQSAYNTLSNNGYLSDTVYSAIISNTTAPGAAVAATLIKNSPLSEKAAAGLENSSLDEGLKDIVENYQDGINSRESLEFTMAEIKQQILGIESDMIAEAINNDSIPEIKEELISYLSEKQNISYNDYINIYKLHLSANDKVSASTVLAGLRNYSSGLSGDISREIGTYCFIGDIYLNSVDENGVDTAYIENYREQIYEAIYDISPLYSAQAEILYSYISDTIFAEYTPLPEDITITRNAERIAKPSDLFKPELNIYPNPTKGFIFIEYSFERNYEAGYELLFEAMGKYREENCNKGYVNIYSVEGKILRSLELENGKGSKTVDISNLPDGIYVLEINDCYGNKTSEKITKQ
jgi:hypothetical protein